MTTEQAAAAIEAVTAAHPGKFRALSEATLTPRGARIEFAPVKVDPTRVVEWFAACGYRVTMIGNCNPLTMFAEYR